MQADDASKRHEPSSFDQVAEKGWTYSVELVQTICTLAGAPRFLTDIHASFAANGLRSAIERHDSPRLFEWLVNALSYQGIADQVARGYIAQHGNASWIAIEAQLKAAPRCSKLSSYWTFHACGYRKTAYTCTMPDFLPQCPLPTLQLRNGALNQLAYSLFLFIRDVTHGDLVAWIDNQMADAADGGAMDLDYNRRESLLRPLRHVHGLADKVLSMALSTLLLASNKRRWMRVGASMIAIDRLVHNLLHRTGILRRTGAEHAYGDQCYGAHGCAAVLRAIAAEIDVRMYNRTFPKAFPRFVQNALWRYCAQDALDVCNGHRIDDRARCNFCDCRLSYRCERIALKSV